MKSHSSEHDTKYVYIYIYISIFKKKKKSQEASISDAETASNFKN